MGYVVLVLGVLMAAVGLDAIATGYPIIQIERGWATVISGSVMLTGGLVTVGLGFAVRTLGEIRAALRAQPGLAADVLRQAARIEPTQVVPQIRPATSLPAHESIPTVVGAGVALNAAEPPTHVARDPLHDEQPLHEPAPDLLEAPPLAAVEPAPSGPEPEHHTAHSMKSDEPTPDGYELQSPSTPEHDIAQAEPPHAPSPSEDEDWLDRALSDFEAGLSPAHPAEVLAPEHVSNAAEDAAAIQAEVPPIHPEPAAAVPAEAEPARAEPVDAAAADAEPSHPVAEPQAPLAPPVHEPAPHDLAVIGRYESDGTSYVMYADGSIEAQSEAGVYRFRSMAELKAFIEG